MTDLDKMALLPCPFCGGYLKYSTVVEGSTYRWRRVQGCCTDGPEVRHETMARDQQAAEADSQRRAIEAWNTRSAPLTPLNQPTHTTGDTNDSTE